MEHGLGRLGTGWIVGGHCGGRGGLRFWRVAVVVVGVQLLDVVLLLMSGNVCWSRALLLSLWSSRNILE